MAFDTEEYHRKREQMRIDSGCQGVDKNGDPLWCGWATCRSECPALIAHGPGHQSKSHCERKGEHDQHMAEGPRDIYRWHGMFSFSGFFDESPE